MAERVRRLVEKTLGYGENTNKRQDGCYEGYYMAEKPRWERLSSDRIAVNNVKQVRLCVSKVY